MVTNLQSISIRHKSNVLPFGTKTTPESEMAIAVNQQITKGEKQLGLKSPQEEPLNSNLGLKEAKDIVCQRIKNFVDRAEKLTFTDSLTKLPNTNSYKRRDRNKFILDACKKQSPLGVIFVDLNDFKPINDNHGHDEGDKALKASAKILTSSVTEEDMVFRKGGDEFLILLKNSDFKKTGEIAKEVCDNFKNQTLKLKDKGKLAANFSASVGYSTFDPTKIENAENATIITKDRENVFGKASDEFEKTYKKSDGAMYIAKELPEKGSEPIGVE